MESRADRQALPDDAVGVVPRDVVAEHEALAGARRISRAAVGHQHVVGLHDGVVLDDDLGRPLADLHEVAVAAPLAAVDAV